MNFHLNSAAYKWGAQSRIHMKISSKKEFHSLVGSLSSLLEDEGVVIKTSRAQELLSRSLGYKSVNGLFASLPVDVKLTDDVLQSFDQLVRQKHGALNVDPASVLQSLEAAHRSYSTVWNSDARCYPKELSGNENYWYLTEHGWIPWSQMDFSRMKVELNIYKVVQSHFGPFLDEYSFSGSARPIWTADIASNEFELQAAKLEQEFGEMPDKNKMFSQPD